MSKTTTAKTTPCKDCGYGILLSPDDNPDGDWRCMPCGIDNVMGRPSRRAAAKKERARL